MTIGPEPMRRILRMSVRFPTFRNSWPLRNVYLASSYRGKIALQVQAQGRAERFTFRAKRKPGRREGANRVGRLPRSIRGFPRTPLRPARRSRGRAPQGRLRLLDRRRPGRAVLLQVSEDVPLVVEIVVAASFQLLDGPRIAPVIVFHAVDR